MKSIVDSLMNVFNICQGQHGKAESLSAYEKRFKIVVDIMEARYGKLALAQCLSQTVTYPENATVDEKKEIQKKATRKRL